MVRILIVEDESSFSEALEFLLGQEGFSIVSAANGTEAITKFEQGGIDLVLLDLMIPEISGTEVCRQIRAKSKVPIIMLTAKDSEVDKVVGLELGADDYVKKPFGLEELLLRVAAVLRRVNGESDSALMCGSISLSVARHEVLCAGKVIDLSPTEFRLLEYLMENKNRVLTKQQILDAVWGIDFDSSTTVVETFVSYLRKKMTPEIDNMLITVRGIGFKLVDQA